MEWRSLRWYIKKLRIQWIEQKTIFFIIQQLNIHHEKAKIQQQILNFLDDALQKEGMEKHHSGKNIRKKENVDLQFTLLVKIKTLSTCQRQKS